MAVGLFLLAVEDHAHSVGDAPQQQEHKAPGGQAPQDQGEDQHPQPPHDDVEDHRDLFPPLEADGVEDNAQQAAGQVDPEEGQAQGSPQGDQADGGVGPQNQQEDGAVVQHLEHPLPLGVGQGVVEAGIEIEQDHRAPENGHADHVQQAALHGFSDEKHGAQDSQHRPHPVAGGVEHLFPHGLAASSAGIGQRFCHGSFPLC